MDQQETNGEQGEAVAQSDPQRDDAQANTQSEANDATDAKTADAGTTDGAGTSTADASDGTGAAKAGDEAAGSVADAHDGDDADDDFEPLTNTYEELRHTADAAELSAAARKPLPPKADQSAFSRATALLEAVAGNSHTPIEDRIFLAKTMPFPNILVKLSEDPEDSVREAVAANADDKNWLVGRLTKDKVGKVREAALRNPQTSWKMRLEGAENLETTAATLDFLAKLGVELEPEAPAILSAMVRRAVALNPNCGPDTLARLAGDASTDVQHAAQSRQS
ncbi:AbrB family transcriptional regulator [Bifidobacterium sp. ESL0763]|uniref:AbrB family transcriptional regulator n=1 Tax=Bifidobacterium sp. ESL0763 TaxID=2983227 RepID=UPI0035A88FF8